MIAMSHIPVITSYGAAFDWTVTPTTFLEVT
jgi:hypothetical protein